MPEKILPITSVVNVTIESALAGLASLNVNTLGLISGETPVSGWDEDQVFKLYTNATDIGADFGLNSKAYAIGVKVFGQQPGILTTNGYLAIILKLPDVNVAATRTIQDSLKFTAVTAGAAGNSITIIYVDDGSKGAETVGVSGSAITVHMEAGASIAAEIAAAIENSGPASALVGVEILDGQATVAQDDFSPALALEGGSDATTESAEACILRTIDDVSYVGILVDELIDDTPLLSLATYVQTLEKILLYATNDSTKYADAAIFDQIRLASLKRTRCLYHDPSLDPWLFAAAYAGRGFSTDFAGSNTAQTMNLKVLAGVLPDTTIDQTALAQVKKVGVDVYVNFGVAKLYTSGANGFFDQVYNELWFKNALQTAIFNFLGQTQTKIPQTEQGVRGLKNVVRTVCAQAVNNGFAAPGTWTSPDVFGNPADLLTSISGIGYYVWAAPLSTQSTQDRQDRIAPPIKVALKSAGAFHSVNVTAIIDL